MRLSTIVRSGLSFVLAGLFLYYAFRNADLNALWKTILRANILWVLVLIPINLAGHWFRAVRWRYLLSPFKPELKLRNLFSAVMIGFAVNNVLPRVGEFVRPVVVGRLEGISRSSAFGTVVIERIIDFLSFSFLIGVTLFVFPGAIDPFVDDPAAWRPIFLAASLFSCVLFFILFLKIESLASLVTRFRGLLPSRFADRILSILESFRAGLAVGHLRASWFWVAVWSLGIWSVYVLGMYVPLFLFPEVASLQLGIGASVVLLVVTTVAWALPAPGAMGTYHSFLTVALVRLYGVDATSSLGLSVITHELSFVLVMLVGTYFYFVDHSRLGSMGQMAQEQPTVADRR